MIACLYELNFLEGVIMRFTYSSLITQGIGSKATFRFIGTGMSQSMSASISIVCIRAWWKQQKHNLKIVVAFNSTSLCQTMTNHNGVILTTIYRCGQPQALSSFVTSYFALIDSWHIKTEYCPPIKWEINCCSYSKPSWN